MRPFQDQVGNSPQERKLIDEMIDKLRVSLLAVANGRVGAQVMATDDVAICALIALEHLTIEAVGAVISNTLRKKTDWDCLQLHTEIHDILQKHIDTGLAHLHESN